MGEADAAGLPSALGDVHAGPAEDDVEVHAVDADGRVVLDAQVDVFLDAETEVSVVREVLATQLVFSDLKQKKIIMTTIIITIYSNRTRNRVKISLGPFSGY